MNHLRFLRYIDQIARVGSIRQAAEGLHVAASAVNRRLLDVEEELGVALFERLPRGMRLTAAGELFVHYIRSRQADLDQVRSEIEELRGLRRGEVRILASRALAPDFLPQAIARFRALHAAVTFQARFGDHVQALTALRNFDVELVLVFNLSPEADIDRIAEFDQKLVAIMHRTHPLANRVDGLRLQEYMEYKLVLPDRQTGARQMLDKFLMRSTHKPRAVVESNDFEFLRGYLVHEQAITFQFSIGAMREDSDFVAREIKDRGFPKGQLVLAQLRGRQLAVVSQTFANHLIDAMRKIPHTRGH